MQHVVIPYELEDFVDEFRRLIDDDLDTRIFQQEELLTPSFALPVYATALDELDLWHQLNIWSNAPCAIRSRNHDTQSLVDAVKAAPGLYGAIKDLLVERLDDESQAYMRSVLEDGPDERFVGIMQTIRDNHRLDRDR